MRQAGRDPVAVVERLQAAVNAHDLDAMDNVVDGDRIWTEWDISGTRRDGVPFRLRGVVIFGVATGAIASARFYLEPVERGSGDVDAHTARVAGTTATGAPPSGSRP